MQLLQVHGNANIIVVMSDKTATKEFVCLRTRLRTNQRIINVMWPGWGMPCCGGVFAAGCVLVVGLFYDSGT